MKTMSTEEQTHPSQLRTVREEQGRTLRATARAAGIDPAHLSRVERGQARLSFDAALRLARVLGLEECERVFARFTS
jgi:transcriptional regulator with XRE-family HTH domain